MKAELVKARKQKEVHLNNVQLRRTELRIAIPIKLIPSIVFYTRHAVKQVRVSVQETHTRKMNAWSKEQQRPLFDVHDTVKIVDADINPPRYVIDTLALGPKNATLEKFYSKDTLAQIDSLLFRCKGAKVPTTVINDINVATFKYIKACSSQKPARNLTLTKRYIKENDLVAVPFDKGVGVCLMRRESYKWKMSDILKLSQFEKWIKPRANSKDLIEKEEERINDDLTKLLEDGEISSQLREDLKSQGGHPPRLYGLAKVHKTSVPMRPVLSMPGSPYYSIAAKVTEWLSVVPESKC